MDADQLVRMKASVVIPAYNSAGTLRRAVKSALDARAVSEVIVVDDGSDEPQAAKNIIDDLRRDSSIPILLIFQENTGAAGARNTGIKAAREEWVCFLDSDDELLHSGIADRFDHLTKCSNREGIGAVYGTFYRSDTMSLQSFSIEYKNVARDSIGKVGGFPGGLPAYLIRRSAMLEVGLLDIGQKAHEDFDLLLRLYKSGWRIVGGMDACFYRNYTEGSLTRGDKKFTLRQERYFLKKAARNDLLGRSEIRRRCFRNLLKSFRFAVLRANA